ncbi:lysozyme inhibitor LprI family protein [Yoonia sp. SS1-5]|uniref:Lysozyme inhibitor LprI family protein n=1 Tax=Yoonia rhodophyticola TaxID=3137370 RepID=A0AAN0NH68_9RHOB
MNILRSWLIFACLAAPATAQEAVFSPEATERCLENSRLRAERVACIGASSGVCMADGGGSYAESICFSEEGVFWDDRLNAVYQERMAAARRDDKSLADALLNFQRAWIVYRDARCDAVFAAWGEGTGRSPALAECIMRTTAEQALLLEDGL